MMTERKWTPGEWYVDGCRETRDGGYVEVKSEKFHWVCSVTDYSDGTAKPNAHLIASAKKLYEALSCQDPFNEGINNDNPNKRENESSQEYGERLTREAIAQAGGEA